MQDFIQKRVSSSTTCATACENRKLTITGSRILHQIPEGAVTTGNDHVDSGQTPLFDFAAISQHIIPVQEFCNRLIAICTNHYRIIGFPVCVEHPRYYRNQFIFNFCLVLEDDIEFSGYVTIVRKLATMFRNLEEQIMFLSKEEDDKLWKAVTGGDTLSDDSLDLTDENKTSHKSPHFVVGGKIYALCEMIFEDLNNYCECMIPIDDSNTINLKIFPTRPPPAPIYSWHVPLSTVQLGTIANASDLTLSRIVPHIDGISSVAQIAQLADTDLVLTRKAIAHLLYYNCVILLDIYRYGAIYAATAEFGAFVEDENAQDEAIRYVSVGRYGKVPYEDSVERWAWRSDESGLDRTKLIELYSGLRQGLTLRNWCIEHEVLLLGVDVRRFITFGVIKGFLYRVHKYAIIDRSIPAADGGHTRVDDLADNTTRVVNWRDNRRGSEPESPNADMALSKFLDGTHCFDEICTTLQMSEKKVVEMMRRTYKNSLIFIHR